MEKPSDNENNGAGLVYAANEDREHKWEQEPIRIVNMLKQSGLPTQQHIEEQELTPDKIVDVDSRALRAPECVSSCFGRPHAGEYVPTELESRMTEEGKKIMVIIDRGTDYIFRSPNVPSVGTKINRFVVDPNRPPSLDQHSTVPGKVLWDKVEVGDTNINIYKEGQAPSVEEVRDWTERLYLPYYNKMMSVIGSLADRRKSKNERVLVIDGHSFPIDSKGGMWADYYKEYGVDDPSTLPLFVIGDQEGKACDPDIRDAYVEALQKNFDALDTQSQQLLRRNIKEGVGITSLNSPFKGAHNVRFYSSRDQGINALQVECNEGAYIDQEGGDYLTGKYNDEAMRIMRDLMTKTCEDIDPVLKGR